MATFILLLLMSIFSTFIHAIPTSTSQGISRRSVTVDLPRNPAYAPNGPRQYSRALKKWGVAVPGDVDDVTNSFRGGETGDVNAASIMGDREYLSRVGFGTPFQYLNVDLDTGSADVWVYSSETKVEEPREDIFVVEKSSTAKLLNGTTWMITYADSSYAWGHAFHDSIDIGGIPLHNAVVQSAVAVSHSLSADKDIDGIFGMAYKLHSQVIPKQPTVLETLQAHLDKPLFTADLKYRSDEGAYTFGYIDSDRHIDEIKYTALLPNSTFWEFNLTGVHVAGQNIWYLQNWRVIADTGTTFMLLSPDVVDMYYSSVPTSRQDRSLGGVWHFPCNTTLPDFELGLANGWVATVPGKYINYTVFEDMPGQCMGALQPFYSEDFGILGDIFLKAVYAVFDVAGGRIGFAHKDLDL
ncbi:aspartic peptidase domain-containing protein [Apiosordaria backusii]|uniref:Aspartic peptidase domain-containing protein n=1 Tax=Apiosordaria backusii TaxID=314023 RepID=A0AA40BN52_9PEZI|nr:aspartic peptidase domain-containing protein [Apiosordaria backusii]